MPDIRKPGTARANQKTPTSRADHRKVKAQDPIPGRRRLVRDCDNHRLGGYFRRNDRRRLPMIFPASADADQRAADAESALSPVPIGSGPV